MTPAPAYKNVLKELADLVDNGSRELSEFETARFRREAEVLTRASSSHVQGQGYTILGILACLGCDLPAMHAHHRAAIALTGESASSLHNYANSLLKCGLYAAALEHFRRAEAKDPDDEVKLSALVIALYGNQRMDELVEAFERYRQLTGKLHHKETELIEDGTMDAYRSLLDDIEQGLVDDESAKMWKETLLDTEEGLSMMLTTAAAESMVEGQVLG